MSHTLPESWPENLRLLAAALDYPPTPEIAAGLRQLQSSRLLPRRTLRPVWVALAVVILLLAASLSIPAVRAAVLEFLQIGAIRINLVQPEPSATSTPAESGAAPVYTPLPSPTPYDLASWLDLQGETTLEDAPHKAGFDLRLPAYPPELGEPDHIYQQNIGGALVVLLWMDPQSPQQVLLALFEIGPGSWAGEKGAPYTVEHTQVNGQAALWAEGPYPLVLKNDDIQIRRLVAGSVLIWTEDEITYRLESPFSLDETRKIAESLEPFKGEK